jgi:hypothetical protein
MAEARRFEADFVPHAVAEGGAGTPFGAMGRSDHIANLMPAGQPDARVPFYRTVPGLRPTGAAQ